MKLSQNQATSLESFRGLSALAVLLCHFWQVFLSRFYPELNASSLMIAQSSVMIFFAMSGFLIGVSIQQNKYKNNNFILSQYAKSRFLRIYPPLLFAVILCLFLSSIAPMFFESGTSSFFLKDPLLKGKSLEIVPAELLSALTFLNGFLPIAVRFNSPLWSLPYEVWYYVIAGLIATLRPFAIVLSVLLFVVISLCNDRFLAYSVVWFAGFGLSFLRKDNKAAKYCAFLALIYFSIQTLLSAAIFVNTHKEIETFKINFGIMFSLLIFVLLVVYNARFNALKFTSKFAYSLYITHFPIMLFFIGTFESSVTGDPVISSLVGASSMISALAVAYFSSRFFENKKIIDAMLSQRISFSVTLPLAWRVSKKVSQVDVNRLL